MSASEPERLWPPHPLAAAQAVLRAHRASLAQLVEQWQSAPAFCRAVQDGVAALDLVDADLVAGDAAAAACTARTQHTRLQDIVARECRDGWILSGLAWALYALDRVEQALAHPPTAEKTEEVA